MRYSRDHLWICREEVTVRIGLTDYAQRELGEITFIEMPPLGARYSKNDVICSLDSLKSSSDLFAPLAGVVESVNTDLEIEGGAAQINRDPTGAGWIFRMVPDNPDEVESLLSENEYAKLIGGADASTD